MASGARLEFHVIRHEWQARDGSRWRFALLRGKAHPVAAAVLVEYESPA